MAAKYVIEIKGQVQELFYGVTKDGKPFAVKISSETLVDIKDKKGVGYENGIPALIDRNDVLGDASYGSKCILSPMANSSSGVKHPQEGELWIVTV